MRSITTKVVTNVSESVTSETTQIQGMSRKERESGVKITAIVLPTVIGALLILTAAVMLLMYVKRRRLAQETKLHEQGHHLSVPEQGQGQQNNHEDEIRDLNISVSAYGRLNMYVNNNLAGEAYQQLEADKNEEYQEMHDVKNESGNQDRDQIQPIAGPGGEQGNGNNGEEHNLETSPNAYERLNMYENDKLAGEMYQQLYADQPSFSHGENVFGKTDKSKEPIAVIYANEILRDGAYDDLA